MSETPKCDAAIAAAVAAEPNPHSQRGHLWELSRTKLVEHVERAWRFVWEAKEKQALWHGKWAIVKHENNKLRAANRALRVEVANLKIEVGYARSECQSRCAYKLPDCHCPSCSPRKIDKGGSAGLFTNSFMGDE